MSLKDLLGADPQAGRRAFDAFGVDRNPFPAPYESNPACHLDNDASQQLYDHLATFFDNPASRLIVLQAERGCGATHTLRHLDAELREALDLPDTRPGHLIHVTDPRPIFRDLLDQIYTAFLPGLLQGVDHAGAAAHDALGALRPTPARALLQKRIRQPAGNADDYTQLTGWFTGHLRSLLTGWTTAAHNTLEEHSEALRTLFDALAILDLRPLTFILCDRFTPASTPQETAQFLASVRRLLDTQPRDLCLVLCATAAQLHAWQRCLPALRTHLQDPCRLPGLDNAVAAFSLAGHYVESVRRDALRRFAGLPGNRDIVDPATMAAAYEHLAAQQARPPSQRDFLTALHLAARETLAQQPHSPKEPA